MLCYALVIGLVFLVCTYFYSSASIIITILIFIVIVSYRIVKFRFIVSFHINKTFRENYKKVQSEMSHSEQKLVSSDKSKTAVGSGLFSDYESRLGRPRFSLKSNSSLSENHNVRSPSRGNSKGAQSLSDENFLSKHTASSESEMPSPIRSGLSPFRSPLSYSRRFNINAQPAYSASPSTANVSRVSSILSSHSSLKLDGSPNSVARRNISNDEYNPRRLSGRMIYAANQMECDQLPWIAQNGLIPMIRSSPQMPTSPISVVHPNSPSADINSSFKTRVKMRLSKPNRSDLSTLNSTVDDSSNLDESSTTKSVIQVLKEIARKRCLATDDEEEHEGPPQAKRRTEHNLYLSRLEGEEEDSISAPPIRMNGEDERMKRSRDPDWDTPNIAKPKRPRKNYNFVNNEIISSLSSSIGLHVFKHSEKKRLSRKSIAIQVETLIPEEKNEERKDEAQRLVQLKHSPPKTRDTGVVTDPLPVPRPRSPIKEKVVSDVNGILKSALSKFDIQPSPSTTAVSNNTTAAPLSSSASIVIPPLQSTGSPTGIPPMSSNITLSPSSQPLATTLGTSTSFSSASPKNTFSPLSSTAALIPPATAPQVTFSIPSASSEKSFETIKPIKETGKQDVLAKASQDQLALKLETKDFCKPNSPFKFGVSQTDSNLKTSDSQSQATSNSGLFNFKVPETPASNQLPVSSSPTFTFPPKVPESTDKIKVSEEPKNIFGGSSLRTQVTSSITPVTSVLTSQKAELPQLANAHNSSEQKNERLKPTSSGFSFQNKLEPVVSTKEEKKEVSTSGLFTFGKSDNKVVPTTSSLPDAKPFQFGSGGFNFGQSNKGDIGDHSKTSTAQTSSTTSSGSTTNMPVFSFSASPAKKDEKSGGFTFKAPATTVSDQKSLFTFNTPSTKSVITSKPIFGSATTTASSFSATTTTTPSFGTASTVAPSFSSTTTAAPTFGSSPAAPSFSSTTTAAPTFGSSPAVPSFSSTTAAPIFGSTTVAPSFGSTTITSSTKPTFPLFGNVGNSSTVTTATTTTTKTLATNSGISTSTFGDAANKSTHVFGMTSASSTPTFGNTTVAQPVFGSGSNPPSFGSTVNNTPVFGSSLTKNETNAPTGFGSNSTSNTGSTATPAFGVGAPSTGSAVPIFGSVGVGNNNQPTFGSTISGAATNAPAFGSTSAGSSNTPSFGSTAANANVPSFGNALATGTGATSFGNTTAGAGTPLFGAPAAGTTAFSGAGTSNAPSFGSAPAPAFGSGGSVPAFGSSSASTFGSSTLATPSFGGNQPQQSFSNQTGTSFGNTSTFGQTSSTPAFGAPNSFGNTTSSTPAFGATPAFGSSANTFGNAAATPAFGSSTTPAFGSSTAFVGQETNKPFTFNAPASQPAQSGTFNFTTPQPPQSSSGSLFQFGAGSTSSSTNQPFQFNASQSTTQGFTAGFSPGVGGTGQQMFSIGSGSTAPRRMTSARRKK